MFARAAMLGILAGCVHHEEAARVTVTPVSAASVEPVRGVLEQPMTPNIIVPDAPATICDIDPAACDKSACAGHP